MALLPRGGEGSSLTEEQVRILGIVGRVASTLSALGVISIMTAFSLSRHFRNPMHRLIFINSFYNAFDVTCTMISVGGPGAGNSSALCQFQGFLNQMFPISDVLWTLVMAINVFLIVFRRYDTESLRKLEWKYIVVITIVTFAPAFVFLFVNTDDKGLMYGSVTLWCAIAPKWVLFRIVCYYVPIWTSILITMVLYCLVGVEILRRRQALRAVNSDTIELDDTVMPAFVSSPPPSYHRNSNNSAPITAPAAAAITEPDILSRTGRDGDASTSHSTTDESLLVTPKRIVSTSNLMHTPRRSSLSFRQYVLMPLFFFLALLTVWVAPTTNRVASFANPSFSSFPLLLTVGATGSLRGFWNGIVFLTIGMKSWRKRRKDKRDRDVVFP